MKSYKKEWIEQRIATRKLNRKMDITNQANVTYNTENHVLSTQIPYTYLWYLANSDYNKVHKKAFIKRYKSEMEKEKREKETILS